MDGGRPCRGRRGTLVRRVPFAYLGGVSVKRVWVVVALLSCNSASSGNQARPGGGAVPSSVESVPEAKPEPAPEPRPEVKPEPARVETKEPSTWPEFDCEEVTKGLEGNGGGPNAEPEDASSTGGDADPEPKESSSRIGRMVDDAGVAINGELLVDGVQCAADSQWAVTDPDHADGPGELLPDRERVQVVGADGVRRVRVSVDAEESEATVPASPGGARFELALRRSKPNKKAKLRDTRLSAPGPEGNVAKAWIDAQEGVPYRAVGTLTGTFGGGVDTLVVVEPEGIYPTEGPDAEPDFCTTEFVVTLSSGRAQGVLPLVRPAGPKARSLCWCEEDVRVSRSGVELVGVVDLDGNGIDEVVWVSQNFGGPLATRIDVTYFADGDFVGRPLASCSYNGCERFLGEGNCGRSLVKRVRR